MVTILALLGVLVIGLVAGLAWRRAVLVGDQRVLNRLAAQVEAEHRMATSTRATLAAMRQAARESAFRPDHRRQW